MRLTSLLGFAALGLASCSTAQEAAISLSLASGDSLTPQVGGTVQVTVRANLADGSSRDVSDVAACELTGGAPPGTLADLVFTATAPGTTDVRCAWQGAEGSLGITVLGDRPVKAAELQGGMVQATTRVELELVVFAVDPEADYTNFYAQDAGGGPRSGIYLRDLRMLAEPELGVSPAGVGDVIRVRGTYLERRGRSVVEYEALEKLGTAAPVASDVRIADVDPAVWDGCLIRIAEVVVTNPMVDAYTWAIAHADAPTAPTLLVETLLFDPVRVAGQALSAISGPLYIDQAEPGGATVIALAPRFASDVLSGTLTTIPDLAALPDGTAVTIVGASVAAVDSFTSNSGTLYDLFIQDPAGGPRAGIQARDYRDAPVAVAEGDVVTVIGTLGTANGRRVLDYDDVTVTGQSAPTVTPLALAGLDLRTYESSLVKISNLRVSDPAYDANAFEVVDRNGGAGRALVDDLFYAVNPATDDELASITGIVFCDTARCAVAPRRAGDVVP